MSNPNSESVNKSNEDTIKSLRAEVSSSYQEKEKFRSIVDNQREIIEKKEKEDKIRNQEMNQQKARARYQEERNQINKRKQELKDKKNRKKKKKSNRRSSGSSSITPESGSLLYDFFGSIASVFKIFLKLLFGYLKYFLPFVITIGIIFTLLGMAINLGAQFGIAVSIFALGILIATIILYGPKKVFGMFTNTNLNLESNTNSNSNTDNNTN